jgi:hypothetical protein
MARRERVFDSSDDDIRSGLRSERYVDLGQLVAVEELHRAREVDVGDVVQIDCEHLSLRFHDAHDAQSRAGDAHEATARVLSAEELARQRRTEDGFPSRPSRIAPGVERAAAHRHLPHERSQLARRSAEQRSGSRSSPFGPAGSEARSGRVRIHACADSARPGRAGDFEQLNTQLCELGQARARCSVRIRSRTSNSPRAVALVVLMRRASKG